MGSLLIPKLSTLNRLHRLSKVVQLYSLIKMGILDAYQPLAWGDGVITKRHLGTLERWRAIERELGDLEGSSLDIGCNVGFFTFQMERKGFFVIGVEGERLPYHVCNLVKEIGEFNNAVFVRAVVDQDFCTKLPIVDVTIFLSVFHHIVRRWGMGVSTALLRELMRRTTKVLFFETGQSNETNTSWASCLPPMTPDPKSWIENYLFSLGATEVKFLGEFETHLSPVKRCLFAVRKQG